MTTIENANQLFKAFTDETRMRILHILTIDEMCVCQIMEILSVPQSKASRHLSYLRRAGLVKSRKQGLWIHYSLNVPKASLHRTLMGFLRECFAEVPIMKQDLAKAKSVLKSTVCS